jgi:uncharacterized protein (TIGR03067 family)
MKTHAPLIVIIGLMAAACRGDDGPTFPLRGEWKLLSTQDARHTDPGCEQSRMDVRADGTVVFRVGERTTNRGGLQLGTAGKLRLLDLRLSDGTTLLGVYEAKEDELVICFEEAGKGRPAGTAPKGAQWAETWKRVKP